GEWIGARVSGAKLIHQRGVEDVGFVESQTLRNQSRFLDTSDIWAQVELRRSGRGRRQAAGSLAAGQGIRSGLDKSLVTVAAEHRIFFANAVVDPGVASVVIND